MGSEADIGPCPPWCHLSFSLSLAHFSFLVTAASSWHYILPLSQWGREKASLSTMVSWAWTNQVTVWMSGIDWFMPGTQPTSLPIIVCRGWHKLAYANHSLSMDWLVSLPHLIVMEEGRGGGERQHKIGETGECWLANSLSISTEPLPLTKNHLFRNCHELLQMVLELHMVFRGEQR